MPLQVTVGVLALQGAFAEHQATLNSLATKSYTKIKSLPSLTSKLVRTPEELSTCDALIIPGGESTTMVILARISGLLEPLREFVKTKPVWGTCAGAILLAETIEGGKKGGQELLGGMSVKIGRNGFGSQIDSFDAPLLCDPEAKALTKKSGDFVGVFIRAPVRLLKTRSLLSVDGGQVVLGMESDPSRPNIQILAKIAPEALPPLDEEGTLPQEDDPRMIVALRQGHLMLTTFHPELTKDDRFHEYFVLQIVMPSLSSPSSPV